MKYVVEFTDAKTGATSAIDNIEADADYTAEQYIEDCEDNADAEWCEMLKGGEVTLEKVEDERRESMKMYTGPRDSGDFIEEVESIEQGLALIEKYEGDDEEEGNYEEDFYELKWEDKSKVEWLYDEHGEMVTRGDTIADHDGIYLIKDIWHDKAEVEEVALDEEDEPGDKFWKTAKEVKKCWKL